MLKSMGEKVSGKKDELYGRLTGALDARGFWKDSTPHPAEQDGSKPKKSRRAKEEMSDSE